MSCLANQHLGLCLHADFNFNLIKYKLDSSFLHDERTDPANAVHRRAGDLLNWRSGFWRALMDEVKRKCVALHLPPIQEKFLSCCCRLKSLH